MPDPGGRAVMRPRGLPLALAALAAACSTTPQPTTPASAGVYIGLDDDARNEGFRQYIVGGEPVRDIAAWPYVAAIVHVQPDGLEQFCGGTVIASRWVVSAAHCRITDDDLVIVGRNDLNVRGGVQIGIQRVIPHPAYNRSARHDNDIALLMLEQSVPARTPFARLPQSAFQLPAAQPLWVLGWGRLHEGGPTSTRLRRVRVLPVPTPSCRLQYEGEYTVTDNMICAAAEGRDSCTGDSGGPLVLAEPDAHVLVGVVSFGIGCARRDYPGVYTFTPRALDFIRLHVPE